MLASSSATYFGVYPWGPCKGNLFTSWRRSLLIDVSHGNRSFVLGRILANWQQKIKIKNSMQLIPKGLLWKIVPKSPKKYKKIPSQKKFVWNFLKIWKFPYFQKNKIICAKATNKPARKPWNVRCFLYSSTSLQGKANIQSLRSKISLGFWPHQGKGRSKGATTVLRHGNCLCSHALKPLRYYNSDNCKTWVSLGAVQFSHEKLQQSSCYGENPFFFCFFVFFFW